MIEDNALNLLKRLDGPDRMVSIHSSGKEKGNNRFRVAVHLPKPLTDIVLLSGIVKIAGEENPNSTVEIKDKTLVFR